MGNRKQGLTPGTKVSRSGQYGMLNTRGTPTGIERTVVKGEPLPPTTKSGYTYKLVDPTKTR
jgi:hypothetical protein